jgi:hypothetical protein
VKKLEEKKPLGRPRRGWKDNIKDDLEAVGWGVMHWIELAHEMDSWRALLNVLMSPRVPDNVRIFLTSRVAVSFSRILLHGVSYRAGDKIQKNQMSGACRTYGGRERRVQGFGGET